VPFPIEAVTGGTHALLSGGNFVGVKLGRRASMPEREILQTYHVKLPQPHRGPALHSTQNRALPLASSANNNSS